MHASIALAGTALTGLVAARSNPFHYQGPFMGLNIQEGHPDKPPKGYEQWSSPLVLPSPPISGAGGWQDATKKAKAFVGKLTMDEKINLTTGVGTDGRCVGNSGRITRLNWDGFCLQDSPLGVRDTDYNSAFPAAINAATTFDRGLIRARAEAMGAEFRGKGVNVALGPMTNMGRVAAGGRNWEGWGADPYLSGVATAEDVEGIQSQGVIACTKHYIANEQEHYRGGSGGTAYSSNVDDRTMHELLLWPFAEAIRAGTGSIMCAYNRINQTFACENSKTINGLAKGELDFQGFMLSDWAALESGVNSALAGTDMNMPGFAAYGDPNEPNPDHTTYSYWGSALRQAVRNGSVPEARLDDMVTRSMAAFFKMGQDKGFPHVNFDYNTEDTYWEGQAVNEHVDVQADHYKVIREIDAASIILLKNDKAALPLSAKGLKRIAIIGSDAGPNPLGPNGCADRGCDDGTLAMGWGSGTANFPYLIDPYSAIQTYINGQNPTAVIEYVQSDWDYAAVATAAKNADTCLVFANSDSGEGYITVAGNAGDRNNLTLWHDGDELIKNTAAYCNNTIVVMHQVGPVIVEKFVGLDNVTAILAAGIPGQESGNGLVDVLFGDVSPSGRSPYTWAKKRTDYPADVLYSSTATVPQITYQEKLLIDYRWFDAQGIEPRYEFGYGLSYTSFKYKGLEISKMSSSKKRRADAVPAGIPMMAGDLVGRDAWDVDFPVMEARSTAANEPGGPSALYDELYQVAFEIQNTGSYDGHEVPQLYLGFPASANEPVRVLRGFDRVFVSKGEDARVTMTLRRKDISIWDVKSQSWTTPKGKFGVFVGASSRDIRLEGKFST